MPSSSRSLGQENEPTIAERIHWLRTLASPAEINVLIHLRSQPGKSFGARAIGDALRLRGSIAATEQHLADLCGRGFLSVTIGNDLAYAYQPVSAIDAVLDDLAIQTRK